MGEDAANAAAAAMDDPYADEETRGHQSIDTYRKLVGKEIGGVEVLLKLVGTPLDRLKDSFQLLLPTGTREDLVQILDMKGMKQAEQGAVIEQIPVAAAEPGGAGAAGGLAGAAAGKSTKRTKQTFWKMVGGEMVGQVANKFGRDHNN